MQKLVDKLRAWLIGLVREAIRIERFKEAGVYDPEFLAVQKFPFNQAVPVKSQGITKATWDATNIRPEIELSFDQIQTESINAQKEYYEPKN